MTLKEFNKIFEKDIFPIYKHHECTFDEGGIHGVLHIARSLVAAYTLCKQTGADITPVLYAVAFHDSGRKANGVDFWEMDSYNNCQKYLNDMGCQSEWAANTASLIFKRMSKPTNEYKCAYDADVLEIMRPCCGHGGISGFNPEFLKLQQSHKLINEHWMLISETEAKKKELSVSGCLQMVLKIIEFNKDKYPLLHAGCCQ